MNIQNISAAILLMSTPVSANANDTIYLNDMMSLTGSSPVMSASKINLMSTSGVLNEVGTIIGDQIVLNKNQFDVNQMRLAVSTVVDVNDMSTVDKIGRALTEVLMHQMQVRGFNVVDFKVRNHIHVTANGDVVFTRDVTQLHEEENINFVLAGTYTTYNDGIVLNIRLVDMSDHTLISSAQADIPQHHVTALLGHQAKVNVGEVKEMIDQAKEEIIKDGKRRELVVTNNISGAAEKIETTLSKAHHNAHQSKKHYSPNMVPLK